MSNIMIYEERRETKEDRDFFLGKSERFNAKV
jgi:hypothetical protein